MISIGVHDFAIPHEYVQPTRDVVIIRLPLPPKMVGSIEIPAVFRDMAQHNVMVGRIVALGPLAFTYKDGAGSVAKQDIKLGDWVVFRPYAGTQTLGGKVSGTGTWRYLSSFQDVIGVVPADKMPDPAALLWDDDKDAIKPATPPVKEFGGTARERVTAGKR